MPVNGAIVRWDALELYCSSSGSGSHTGIGSGQYGHGVTANSYWTPDTVQEVLGIQISASGASSTDSWSVTYIGPGTGPSGQTYTGTGWSAINAYVLIEDLILYCDGAWRLVGTLSLWINGVQQTIGGSSTIALDEASGGLGPAYVPLIGIPWGGSGSASAVTVSLPDPMPDTYDYCSTCTGSAFVGWRFKEVGGAWIDLPVTLAPGSAPAISGGCTDPGVGSVSASDTYGGTIGSYAQTCNRRELFDEGEITECYQECTCPGEEPYITSIIQDPPVPWDVYKEESETYSRGGSVRLVPDLTRAIRRFNSDYAALWYRDEFPLTQRNGSYSCDNNGALSSGSTTSTVHAMMAVLLSTVTESAHVIEEGLAAHAYAPWTASGSWSKDVVYDYTVYGGVLCGDAPNCATGTADCISDFVGDWEPQLEDESYSASRSYSFPSAVGSDVAPYMGHAEPMARYINSWCNPHWSYFLFTNDWEVDGGPETWNDYWEQVGSQWLSDPALPEGENHETRNHIVSDPLATGGLNSFLDSFCAGQRWLGVCRWQTKAITPLVDYTYDEDSEDLWTSETGTISVGVSGITVTP